MKGKQKRGPEPERVKITGDWEKAVAKVVKKKTPTEPQKEAAPKKRTK